MPRRSLPLSLLSSASRILPIIKFSVEWWNTLHQPSTDFTSTVDPSMRLPLLVMAVGFTLLFFAMHLKAMRNEILRRRVKALRTQAVAGRDRLAAQGARSKRHGSRPARRFHLDFVCCRRGDRRRAHCLADRGRWKQAADLEALERQGVKRRSSSAGE